MQEDLALSTLAALAEPTRLRIVRFLLSKGAAGAAAGEIGAAVGAAPSRCSFHLAALSRAGLCRPERRSRRMIYRADSALLLGLAEFLAEDCRNETTGRPDGSKGK